jgi:transposase InsO family protein
MFAHGAHAPRGGDRISPSLGSRLAIASHDYTDLLNLHGIAISMSRKGNPWDNAACESFMKS